MGRLKNIFGQNKGKKILNVYCTAGYPHLDSTVGVMEALQKDGADIIELGMPYSDPLADGDVIQNSGMVALKNGMTIAKLFEQLKDFRQKIDVPVVLMGYLNPVLQYGFERFCQDAAAVGIDGLILPDLPEYEYESTYRQVVKQYGLDFIFLVTPDTSVARIRQLDELSSGFLYAVSSSSTTGRENSFDQVEKYLVKLKTLGLKNPILVGFGIKDKESFDKATRYADGGIIGSAYIRSITGKENIEESTNAFLHSIIG